LELHSPHEMGLIHLSPPGLVHHLGAAGIEVLVGARELGSVFVRTLYYVARGKREKGAVGRTDVRDRQPIALLRLPGGRRIAAEIESMVVTEQIDAPRMCAGDPIDFLAVPRFLASLVMTTVLIAWAGVVAFAAGAATAYMAFEVPLRTSAT
jgi:hypothetical protein